MRAGTVLSLASALVAICLSQSTLPQGNEAHTRPSAVASSAWLQAMAPKLSEAMPENKARLEFLRIVAYESKRAGVDAQLVLALTEKASQFRKYSVAASGARGYMQIHPNWLTKIGEPSHNLFSTRTNIRYGCVLLRQFLDEHKENYAHALTVYEQQISGRFDERITATSPFAEDVITLWRGKWSYSE